MKTKLALILMAFSLSCSQSKETTLSEILKDNPFVNKTSNDPQYEVQIIYTQIERDSLSRPNFKTQSFNLDNQKYFYPASTVKMPVALLALEKLNKLSVNGLSKESVMITDSLYEWQSKVDKDTTAENSFPSIAHYIKKLFVVSDNDAYNRLYEFLGQAYINEQLHAKGYENTRITHRLSIPLTLEQNQTTNPIRFYNDSTLVYEQPACISQSTNRSDQPIYRGKGYIENNSLIERPFEFTYKNNFPLEEMHKMLIAIIFPDFIDSTAAFQLSKTDYEFLYNCMSLLPRESSYPNYDTTEYYDAYVKFLLFGNDKSIPDHIKIYNKIGQAYGYMTDNAYIVDSKNQIEFFLSATIHVNENRIFNDGVYEYDPIGYKFMKELGQLIYNYEIKKK